MKGSECKFVKYMDGSDKRFVIPVYQRNYDWKTANCKHLYDDLVKIISATFKEMGKANIDDKKANIGEKKVNIGEKKVNIDDAFTSKTASNVRKLQETLGTESTFGRSAVERVLGLKPTRSSALLREMAERGMIEPVTGHGKGKYRFRQHES
ncbi:MAG: hypothetical protein ACTTH3_02290 [Schwartzia sp. (in: firmicutes)]